jgi:hypothetical protein
VKSLAEDVKLSACERHPSLFSLSFDFVYLICFLGKVFAIQVWGNVLLRFAYLAPFLWYCISGHIGDNVPF